MRWVVTALALLFQAIPPIGNLPPAYPRFGAAKILDNDRVQVWNIAWEKGHPSPMHHHLYDLVGIYYEPGDRMIISPDGSKRPVSTKAGDAVYQARGVTHIEEGVSESPLRAVFVELKQNGAYGSEPAASDLPAFTGAGGTEKLNNDRATIWEYAAPPAPARHRHLRDAVVAVMDGQKPKAKFVKRGTVHTDEGTGKTARFYVFEIK